MKMSPSQSHTNNRRQEPSRFWGTRFRRLGHTGWSSATIYAYDQYERLANVERALDALAIKPGKTACDFGCGSGDFSRLLLSKGLRVWAYDPYVRPALRHPRLRLIGSRSELMALDEKFDLVLSVTVLDHILDDTDFLVELRALRSMMRDDGRLVLLEYATDDASSISGEYQAFRPFVAWRAALAASGWSIETVRPVPNPEAAPSMGFSRYTLSRRTRILSRLKRIGGLEKPALALLKLHARHLFRRYGVGRVEASCLKLMLCKPE